jgi:hypothetical protein
LPSVMVKSRYLAIGPVSPIPEILDEPFLDLPLVGK